MAIRLSKKRLAEIDEKFVKLAGDTRYWLVQGGKRIEVRNQTHMMEVGIRAPIYELTEAELASIPIQGQETDE